ncbi:MAG: threonylcarbamoyl-AMP synthase [Ignavibacteriae bacterium HGW-Ignavibacteriae-4]|jgi:L-threonylcarbamoyladenylate synthase|nr:MAG: threonylcarbamoyl-AMP synthase [Ignavibacteriae bacterium HGW-Ignavibacteriae-4]
MITITEINKNNLEKMESILDNSGIIVFPTETVWGIGCRFDDEKAVSRLYNIKGRNTSIPLQIQISKLSDFEKYSVINNKEVWSKITSKYLPGPLSIVLDKKNVPDYVTSNLDTVAFRLSNCSYLLELIDYLGYPIASTSCNLSGKPVITDKEDILDFAEQHSDIFVDIDCGKENISSTIIQLINNEINYIREGVISFDEIKKSIEK